MISWVWCHACHCDFATDYAKPKTFKLQYRVRFSKIACGFDRWKTMLSKYFKSGNLRFNIFEIFRMGRTGCGILCVAEFYDFSEEGPPKTWLSTLRVPKLSRISTFVTISQRQERQLKKLRGPSPQIHYRGFHTTISFTT